jgi:hypothetical protein
MRGVRGKITLSVLPLICACCPLLGQGATHAKNPGLVVPFVGCESEVQSGPVDAPSDRTKTIAIPPGAAQRLAYYKAEEGPGVLAPRGWHCFGAYGSNGATLYVSPDPINAADLFSTSWKGFAGSVIQISYELADTSGRFAVAKTIARVFPSHKAFVEKVVAEGIQPASSFPYGLYPADLLMTRGQNVVEFWTPAKTEGLGTASSYKRTRVPSVE